MSIKVISHWTEVRNSKLHVFSAKTKIFTYLSEHMLIRHHYSRLIGYICNGYLCYKANLRIQERTLKMVLFCTGTIFAHEILFKHRNKVQCDDIEREL